MTLPSLLLASAILESISFPRCSDETSAPRNELTTVPPPFFAANLSGPSSPYPFVQGQHSNGPRGYPAYFSNPAFAHAFTSPHAYQSSSVDPLQVHAFQPSGEDPTLSRSSDSATLFRSPPVPSPGQFGYDYYRDLRGPARYTGPHLQESDFWRSSPGGRYSSQDSGYEQRRPSVAESHASSSNADQRQATNLVAPAASFSPLRRGSSGSIPHHVAPSDLGAHRGGPFSSSPPLAQVSSSQPVTSTIQQQHDSQLGLGQSVAPGSDFNRPVWVEHRARNEEDPDSEASDEPLPLVTPPSQVGDFGHTTETYYQTLDYDADESSADSYH